MRLIDDYEVKAEAYLYWIKSSKMKDISTDGYVGVTCDIRKRLNSHVHNLRNKKRNRYYHNGFVKRFHEGDLEMVIVNCGSEDEMYEWEQKLRPTKAIGWNYAVGGSSHGTSYKDIYIMDKGMSISRFCSIVGLRYTAVLKRRISYDKSLMESLEMQTKVDCGHFCNFPTKTGYVKFLFPYSVMVDYVKQVESMYAYEKNCTVIGREIGVTASVVKKIVVEVLKEPYPDVKNCCFKGVWFQFYTKLEPYDLYCILKMLDDGVTQKVIAQVYGLQGYNIGKISQTWRKARDTNVQYI